LFDYQLWIHRAEIANQPVNGRVGIFFVAFKKIFQKAFFTFPLEQNKRKGS
jgi:hypothetical protein